MATRAAEIRRESSVAYVKGIMADWIRSMRAAAEAEIRVRPPGVVVGVSIMCGLCGSGCRVSQLRSPSAPPSPQSFPNPPWTG
jgi:hypothetical protein